MARIEKIHYKVGLQNNVKCRGKNKKRSVPRPDPNPIYPHPPNLISQQVLTTSNLRFSEEPCSEGRGHGGRKQSLQETEVGLRRPDPEPLLEL